MKNLQADRFDFHCVSLLLRYGLLSATSTVYLLAWLVSFFFLAMLFNTSLVIEISFDIRQFNILYLTGGVVMLMICMIFYVNKFYFLDESPFTRDRIPVTWKEKVVADYLHFYLVIPVVLCLLILSLIGGVALFSENQLLGSGVFELLFLVYFPVTTLIVCYLHSRSCVSLSFLRKLQAIYGFFFIFFILFIFFLFFIFFILEGDSLSGVKKFISGLTISVNSLRVISVIFTVFFIGTTYFCHHYHTKKHAVINSEHHVSVD